MPRFEIVGIVGDVLAGLNRRPGPTFYRPMPLEVQPEVHAVLHRTVAPRGLVSAVRPKSPSSTPT